MIAVAIAGLAVNLVVFRLLHGSDRDNINVRGAALHVLGDILGSVAALAAGLIIWLTGWMPIDPILSVLVAVIILRSGWKVVRDAGHILLEGTPKDVDPRDIGPDLLGHVDGLRSVDHVHVWSITEKRPMATLHAVAGPQRDPRALKDQIKSRLKRKFGLDHVTVELDPAVEPAE